MTAKEMRGFLSEKLVARFASIRPDGYPHVTPLWYAWDGTYLWFIIGHGERPRQHIRNLQKNSRVAVIIDRDLRPQVGDLSPGAQGVLMRGRAKLLTDHKSQEEAVRNVMERYGGNFPQYVKAVIEDGKPGWNRVVARVKPEKVYAWDMRKLQAGYKSK